MDSTNLDTLDQSALNNLLGGSGGAAGLIPESLVTAMVVSFVILNILGLLFFVFYVLNAIRSWKVQSAVFQMQKDVTDIKAELAKTRSAEPVDQPVSPQTVPQPGDSSKLVAADSPDDSSMA